MDPQNERLANAHLPWWHPEDKGKRADCSAQSLQLVKDGSRNLWDETNSPWEQRHPSPNVSQHSLKIKLRSFTKSTAELSFLLHFCFFMDETPAFFDLVPNKVVDSRQQGLPSDHHRVWEATCIYGWLIKKSYHKFCHLPAAVDSDSDSDVMVACKKWPKLAYTTSEVEGEHVFWCVLSVPCDLNIQGDYKTDVNIQMLAFPSCR